jgi:hypothetical protein
MGFDDGEFTQYAELVQASITPVTEDKFGAVKDASIAVRCPLKIAKLVNRGHRTYIRIPLLHIDGISADTVLDSSDIGFEREDTYLAILLSVRQMVPLNQKQTTICGILLQPLELRGTFRRIGSFRGIENGRDPEILKKIVAPLPGAADLPCEHYDSVTGKHTIRVA